MSGCFWRCALKKRGPIEGGRVVSISFLLSYLKTLEQDIFAEQRSGRECGGEGNENEGGWDQEMAPHVMVNRPTAYKSPGYYRYTTWSNVAMQTIKYTFIHHKYNLYTLKGPMMP